MFVRLAFAVAAHLTPEILLVDEVLAVGDVEFQRRCLGRMNEVARSGRTVVFVSHNLASIERLCRQCVLLSRGVVEKMGATAEVLGHYLSRRGATAMLELQDVTEREGAGRARITGMEVLNAAGTEPMDTITFREPFRIRIRFRVNERIAGASFGFGLLTASGQRVFITESVEAGKTFDLEPGNGEIDCVIERPNILPGTYRFELWISDIPGVQATDHLPVIGEIEVAVPETSTEMLTWLTSTVRGNVYMDTSWGGVQR
jgi:lipopolysaccharide transport system ATP-binding protein